jgi:hypothetical protein
MCVCVCLPVRVLECHLFCGPCYLFPVRRTKDAIPRYAYTINDYYTDLYDP